MSIATAEPEIPSAPLSTGAEFVSPYPEGRNGPYQNFIWFRTLLTVPKIIRNPLEAFAKFQFDAPVSRYKLFSVPFALVNDPELIRHVFVERANVLEAEPLRQKILRPALRDGMLTAEGDVWRRARKTIAPVFSPRHVNGFALAMKSATETFLDDMESGPRQLQMAPVLSRLAYLVLSETLFSGDINEDGEQILADVAKFLEHLSNADPLDLMGAPEWMPRPTRMRGGGVTDRLRTVVREAAKRRQLRIEAGESVPEDFLTLLLKAGESEKDRLTIEEIEDNIITFIAAGHETTARALAWMLYLLAHDEEARARVEAEVDALDTETLPPEKWGAQLPWLTACFEETMRLFPPAAVIIRRLAADIDHGDYQIPAGTNIYVSPWVLHRHTTLWDDAAAFRPERFFGKNRSKIDKYAYLPFGMGPRVCIGASFAMQEAQIILALMLKRFRFDYSAARKPWPVMKITIQPDNGMPMRFHRRDGLSR
ncbi:MAG: cytochrome P450 [Pseudomonadota bacterium]